MNLRSISFAAILAISLIPAMAAADRPTATNLVFLPGFAASHAGCDPEADFCTPGTMDCVIYGTGHLVGASGKGNFASSLNVGDTSRVFGGRNCPAGLTDARTAEIHLVVADHGDLDPAQMPAAIMTPGPGVQAAVHAP